MRDPTVWVVTRAGATGRTYYAVRWLDPASGKMRCESCGGDKRRAESVAARKRQDLAAGLDTDLVRVGWAVFVERVLAAKAADVRPSSLAEYKHTLSAFTDVIQPVGPHGVRHEDVKKFLSVRKAKGDRPATLEKHRTNLNLLFGEGIRLRHLAVNPVKGVRPLKYAEKDWHLYDTADVDKLLAVTDDKFWGPLIYLAYTTGLRRGELLNLTWPDVDADARVLKVNPKPATDTLLAWNPKGAERRVVPLTDDGVLRLQRLKVAAEPGNPYVFLPVATYKRLLAVGYAGRNPVAKFTTRFLKLCRLAGVEADAFHSLRKSCITRWLESGVPPHVAQKLAGHADIQTTIKHYSKVRTEGIDAARAASANYRPKPQTLRESCARGA